MYLFTNNLFAGFFELPNKLSLAIAFSLNVGGNFTCIDDSDNDLGLNARKNTGTPIT